MSHTSFKSITQDISQALGALRKEQPDTMAAFGALAKAAGTPGALSELHKELIALAIGVAAHCDGCIGFHVRNLRRLGVDRAAFMETLSVAVYMGGGPSLMFAADAIHAYDEFADARA